MLPISALIRDDSTVWSVSPENTVYEALQILAERDIGVVPVLDSGNLVGIFSERDYARRIVLLDRTSRNTKISEVMTKNVFTVSLSDSIEHCMKIVVSRGFRHLPVLDNGELIAIVSGNDLLAEVIRTQEMEIGNLENLLSGVGEIT